MIRDTGSFHSCARYPFRRWALVILLLAGCGTTPAGTSDERAADAGEADAGEADAGDTERSPDDVAQHADATREEDASDAAVPTPCAEACIDGVCDESSGACVECVVADDCGGDTLLCIENDCVACAPDDETCTEPTVPDEPDPPDEPESFNIRFATYNVRTPNLRNGAWGDYDSVFDSDDAERMRRVADTIASQNLTVVAAQEINRPLREAVLRRLATQHQQNWNSTTPKSPGDDTLVLFRASVWKKIAETHYIIPIRNRRKRYSVGVLLQHRATGRQVWFYSVHFSAGATEEAKRARDEAARRTVKSIKNHAIDHNRPFVLGGDFNATAASSVGDIFRNANFMRDTRGAADKKVNLGCATFNRFAGSAGRQDCPGGVARHIDQVWMPKSGVRVLKHQVTASKRTSRASDHNPVTTILTRR